MKINLLARNKLVKTAEVDFAEWNYRPFVGYISRKRYNLFLKLIKNKSYDKILNVGYGSGVFLPELAKYGNSLLGIDVHNKNNEVMTILKESNVDAELVSTDAAHTPFEDKYFDLILGISSFEFIEDIETAAIEMKRILKDEGELVIITPGNSKILDWGLKLITGRSASEDYNGRREKLLNTLMKHYTIVKRKTFPVVDFKILNIYTGYKFTKK